MNVPIHISLLNRYPCQICQNRIKEILKSYKPNQTCRFCENPESTLTKETCCTGCSKLNGI